MSQEIKHVHSEDVIFTQEGLNKLIKLIRQNPEMVSEVRVATESEIAEHNLIHDKLENGKIPGKGITVIQANGELNCVAVGSDVKIPDFEVEIQNSTNFKDGTITFKVDGEYINIPVKGIVQDTNNTIAGIDDDRRILSQTAVEDYVENYVEDYVEKYVKNFKSYIPGSYVTYAADNNTKVWQVQETSTKQTEVSLKAAKVYGAVFNDYAEYRATIEANPGRVVIENGNGTLSLAEHRLQLGGNIISDTFGFAIGKTHEAQTPLAVCGRVLAYPYEPIGFFKPGAAVCSGPNGTVSIMTRDEIKEWPDAIIGYVSEIPTYETWGTDNIKVDGRLWIKVV